jgi:protein-tyrosine-phosphatase
VQKDVSGWDPAEPERTTGHRRLTIDQRLALKAASGRLQREFQGVFDAVTTERLLYTHHDQFTGDSAITRFLRTERFARQRLQAFARVEGHDAGGKLIALFLCTHNTGCSQLALGFFQRLAAGRAVGWSGGSEPGDEVHPSAVEVMRECGIDITGEFPKPWTSEIVQAADVVITMGCRDACPVFPGKRYLDWDIRDPAGMSLDLVRAVRDEIERRVRCLLDQLNMPAHT